MTVGGGAAGGPPVSREGEASEASLGPLLRELARTPEAQQLRPGERLGHYVVRRRLGAGAMGEVFAADDTRLGREVALKLLPAEYLDDGTRRARLEREARALAALNHPGIVSVYAIERVEGRPLLVMELVEGEPLSARIPRGGLPPAELWRVALALADAVGAAHLQGVVHRDLKPDNVMRGSDGRIKVLDFGLAKLEAPDAARGEAPTDTATVEGKLVGTPAYMAPEQAQGRAADARTDVFALGVVLFELATGRRPFGGDSLADVLSAVLRDTPPRVDQVQPRVPAAFAQVVARCLDKDPRRRFQTALDVRNALEDAAESLRGAGTTGGAARSGSKAAVALAAVALALLGLLAWWATRQAAPAATAAPRRSFRQVTTAPGAEVTPSLAPDGKWLVYASRAGGNWDIYRQRIGGHNPQNLTADYDGEDLDPAVSPDGEQIAFRSERLGGGLFVMGATGESVRKVASRGYSPSWSPDGRSLAFSTGGGLVAYAMAGRHELWRVDVQSGAERRLAESSLAAQPTWSPGGRRVAFTVVQGGGWRDIVSVPAEGGEPVAITSDAATDWSPAWAADGWLYFSSDRSGSMDLWRVRVDEGSGRPRGAPEPVTAGSVAAWNHGASVSRDGASIAYAVGSPISLLYRLPLDAALGRSTGPAVALGPGVHPTARGGWLAYVVEGPIFQLVVMRPDGSERRTLVQGEARLRYPHLSPDGSTVIFSSGQSGSYQLWAVGVDGSRARQLTDVRPGLLYGSFSPDGGAVVACGQDDEGCVVFPWPGDTGMAQPVPVPAGPGGRRFLPSLFSPDGRALVGALSDGEQFRLARYLRQEQRFDEPLGPATFLWSDYCGSVWLDDHRLLLRFQDRVAIADLAAGRLTRLGAPDLPPGGGLALSPDGRSLYVDGDAQESDLWLATLSRTE